MSKKLEKGQRWDCHGTIIDIISVDGNVVSFYEDDSGRPAGTSTIEWINKHLDECEATLVQIR